MTVITMTREMGSRGSRVADEVCARLGLRHVERGLPRASPREIVELAAVGDVLIRGWGANYVLETIMHVIRVRVTAPMEARLQNVCMRMQSLDVERCRREIEASDRNHLAVIQQMCGVDTWQDPSHYHLVLDTSRDSIDACARRIIELAERPGFHPTTGSLRMLESCLAAPRRMLREAAASLGD